MRRCPTVCGSVMDVFLDPLRQAAKGVLAGLLLIYRMALLLLTVALSPGLGLKSEEAGALLFI